ncbi:hypothetical protein SAMN04487969_13439 [Paenibacillus algorifonticola]|uniref:RHS repeat-associated core domain-containing protein n=1 Tax=Paenibacillus algorifonticola TaxID=684063 RepID=A0A1I2IDG1_9BACL|nr:hypothetical protein [Paenibacillus algorifonticola]SFF40422.1 hypothetical protein SAMN04487969_13439 [Paenibacillus algorifonticola]
MANEGDLTNPLSQNLYTYVHNNPLNWVDSLGHWIEGIDNQLSVSDQTKIRQLTSDWYEAKGNKALQANLSQAAQNTRIKHFINVANKTREKLNDDFVEAIADSIPNPRSAIKNASKSIIKMFVKSMDDDVTFIYRRSDNTDSQSMTAEHRDVMKMRKGVLQRKGRNDEALSWSTNMMLPGWVSTVEAINATGIFEAKLDGNGHVSIAPTAAVQKAFGTMADWRNSYDNANTTRHFYTAILMTRSALQLNNTYCKGRGI